MNDKTQERAAHHVHKVRMPYGPAIEAMQAVVDLANDTITDPMYVIAASMALDALKREAAEPPNDPLTLEELRGMGGEPYYHVSLQGSGDHWEVMDTLIARNIQDYYYGERWLAYRRKPDRGTK